MKNFKKITAGLLIFCMLCLCTIGFTGCFGSGNPMMYSLTLSAELEDGTAITGNDKVFLYGNGSYAEGTNVNYGAISLDDRYEFVKWEENNNQNANTYITEISQHASFTAIFKRKYIIKYAEFYISNNNLNDVDDITMYSNVCTVQRTNFSIYLEGTSNGLNNNKIVTNYNSAYQTERVYFNTLINKNGYFDGQSQSLKISWFFDGIVWDDGKIVNIYNIDINSNITINPASGTKVEESLSNTGYLSNWYTFYGDADNLKGGSDVANALVLKVRFLFQ